MKLYQEILACGLIGASSFLGCDKKPNKNEGNKPAIVKTEEEKPILPIIKPEPIEKPKEEPKEEPEPKPEEEKPILPIIKPKKPSWPVYDSKLKQFIKRERGINETVLNSLDNLEYRTKKMLHHYQRVENEEQSFEFIPRGEYEGIISIVKTLYTMVDNLKWIETVDKTDNVKNEYKRLKKLLTKCNKVYKNTKNNNLKRTIKLCNIISEYIKPGELTPDSVSIVDLVNGKLCDCNDISPAYFALLNYYHVNCYVTTGKVKYKDGTEGLHAWLFIKTQKFCFEFDPTWYGHFTPLDVRNKETNDVSSLKDKYMKYKK